MVGFMGSDRQEKMFELDNEISGILTKIEKMLEEWHCELNKSCDYDEKFGYNGIITVFNPVIDRNLSIDITKTEDYSVISMYFADWHSHCEFNNISDVIDTIRNLVTNEFGSAQVYLGEEHRRSIASGIIRHDAENNPNAECLGLPKSYNEHWLKNSAEMEIKFWDPKYDKTITIESR